MQYWRLLLPRCVCNTPHTKSKLFYDKLESVTNICLSQTEMRIHQLLLLAGWLHSQIQYSNSCHLCITCRLCVCIANLLLLPPSYETLPKPHVCLNSPPPGLLEVLTHPTGIRFNPCCFIITIPTNNVIDRIEMSAAGSICQSLTGAKFSIRKTLYVRSF